MVLYDLHWPWQLYWIRAWEQHYVIIQSTTVWLEGHWRPQFDPIPRALAWVQGRCPSRMSSLSTFTLAFIWHQNWKNILRWCKWLTVMRPFPPPREGKKNSFSWSGHASHLVVKFYFFALSLFYVHCNPFNRVECSCECLWILSTRSHLYVSYNKLHNCTLCSCLLHCSSSFSVQEISVNISDSQQPWS